MEPLCPGGDELKKKAVRDGNVRLLPRIAICKERVIRLSVV